jgi:hypothetical protein
MTTLPLAFLVTPPLVEGSWRRLAVIAASYLVTLGLSGPVVRFFVLPRHLVAPVRDPNGPRFDSSTVIGKCENLIALTFTILGQGTGIAVVFAAKALVRAEDIKKNPGFYLGGTLVNLIWAVMIGGMVRIAIVGF